MNRVRATWRLLRVIGHLAAGLLTVWLRFSELSPAQREARVQRWAGDMLSILNIELQVLGTVPDAGPLLLVANHISWLDILVVHASRHCRFISKSDIRSWPLIGALATAAGTLYIQRESRRDAMRVVHSMAAALQAGQVLAVFPEGTTGDGRDVLPFHGNLLQAAIVVHAPVQPVALRFADRTTGQPSLAPCYVGDETLLTSLWRTLCSSDLRAIVHFGAQQTAQGRDRRVWAEDLREAIVTLRSVQSL